MVKKVSKRGHEHFKALEKPLRSTFDLLKARTASDLLEALAEFYRIAGYSNQVRHIELIQKRFPDVLGNIAMTLKEFPDLHSRIELIQEKCFEQARIIELAQTEHRTVHLLEVDSKYYSRVEPNEEARRSIEIAKSEPIRDWQDPDSYPNELKPPGWAWEFLRRNDAYREFFAKALLKFEQLLIACPEENRKSIRIADIEQRRAETSKQGGRLKAWCDLSDPRVVSREELRIHGDLEYLLEQHIWGIRFLVNPVSEQVPMFQGPAANSHDIFQGHWALDRLYWPAGDALLEQLSEEGSSVCRACGAADQSVHDLVDILIDTEPMLRISPTLFLDQTKVAAVFDLSEAIEPQLEWIKSQLETKQSLMAKAGLLPFGSPPKRVHARLFRGYLILLDADAAGASIADVEKFYRHNTEPLDPEGRGFNSDSLRKRLRAAKRYLSPTGYRGILATRRPGK